MYGVLWLLDSDCHLARSYAETIKRSANKIKSNVYGVLHYFQQKLSHKVMCLA